jgi:hypothetical protein
VELVVVVDQARQAAPRREERLQRGIGARFFGGRAVGRTHDDCFFFSLSSS